MMAEFPLDPQLAKMMVAAPEYRCQSSGLHATASAMPCSLSAGSTLGSPQSGSDCARMPRIQAMSRGFLTMTGRESHSWPPARPWGL